MDGRCANSGKTMILSKGDQTNEGSLKDSISMISNSRTLQDTIMVLISSRPMIVGDKNEDSDR